MGRAERATMNGRRSSSNTTKPPLEPQMEVKEEDEAEDGGEEPEILESEKMLAEVSRCTRALVVSFHFSPLQQSCRYSVVI